MAEGGGGGGLTLSQNSSMNTGQRHYRSAEGKGARQAATAAATTIDQGALQSCHIARQPNPQLNFLDYAFFLVGKQQHRRSKIAIFIVFLSVCRLLSSLSQLASASLNARRRHADFVDSFVDSQLSNFVTIILAHPFLH